MTEITARLSTALAHRYKIERHLGEGGSMKHWAPNFSTELDGHGDCPRMGVSK